MDRPEAISLFTALTDEALPFVLAANGAVGEPLTYTVQPNGPLNVGQLDMVAVIADAAGVPLQINGITLGA